MITSITVRGQEFDVEYTDHGWEPDTNAHEIDWDFVDTDAPKDLTAEEVNHIVWKMLGALRGPLSLERAPQYLQFVLVGTDWKTLDALDQPDDEANPEEKCYAGRLSQWQAIRRVAQDGNLQACGRSAIAGSDAGLGTVENVVRSETCKQINQE